MHDDFAWSECLVLCATSFRSNGLVVMVVVELAKSTEIAQGWNLTSQDYSMVVVVVYTIYTQSSLSLLWAVYDSRD